MITPTVGRIVWYHPHIDAGGDINGQPHAAMLAHILPESGLVNLTVFNENGSVYAKTSVKLLQAGDTRPAEGDYAEWPQREGQAAKTETSEGAIAKQVTDLANDVDGKFKSLGDWLNPRLAAIELKLNGSTSAPANPPPQPDLGGAGAADQVQA